MKTIEFEGKKYEVEDWVNWVARDSIGVVYGFDKPPLLGINSFYDNFSQKCKIGDSCWQDSLTKV